MWVPNPGRAHGGIRFDVVPLYYSPQTICFTTKFPGLPGTRLIDLERIKGWVDLGATQWFYIRDPWSGNAKPPLLKNISRCSFLLRFHCQEKFPQKQFYCVPFDGCLESSLQSQFPVRYEIFQLFDVFFVPYGWWKMKLIRKISWLVSIWPTNQLWKVYMTSQVFVL